MWQCGNVAMQVRTAEINFELFQLKYGLNSLGPLCLWQCLYINLIHRFIDKKAGVCLLESGLRAIAVTTANNGGKEGQGGAKLVSNTDLPPFHLML